MTTVAGVLRGILGHERHGLAMLLGAKVFPLASEQTFRKIAYVVIMLAAVVALPVMDTLIGR